MTFSIVFPGQGSQSVGMLSALADSFPLVRETFTEASTVLNFDLWEMTQSGPEETLNNTVNTQPALLAAGVATWQVWLSEGGPAPDILAGHSLGEYTALVCSGAMQFSDAVSLVADRGRYMQEAVPEGTGSMAAILGMDNETLESLCNELAQGQVVAPANFNSEGQVVIAGHKEAVSRVVAAAADAGARRSVILPVSVPSHCALMRKAADRLAQRLESIELVCGHIPVIHNVDVSSKSDPAAIKQALVEQLFQPVRWVETVQRMASQGIENIIECGPGKVLCGLIKRIDQQLGALPVLDSDSLHKALSTIADKGDN